MRKISSVFVLVLALIIPVAGGWTATIRVPLDQPTIQQGIAAAVEGDTVLVAAGNYTGAANRNISFGGKNLVVMSEEGAAQTIIDCEGLGTAFILYSGEDSTSVIQGFTIRYGNSTNGGGIAVSDAAPTIVDCVFSGNVAVGNGAGIYYGYTPASGEIRGCVFFGNTATYRGGGINCDHAEVRISDCLFYENSVTNTGGEAYYGGGGVHGNSSLVTVTSCTFARNSAATGSAGIHSYASNISVESSIVAFSTEGPGLSVNNISQCVVFGNAEGDSLLAGTDGILLMDPLFCDRANDDYSLCANSPCLPGSPWNPWSLLVGAQGQGCGDCETAVEPASWGGLKGMYR